VNAATIAAGRECLPLGPERVRLPGFVLAPPNLVTDRPVVPLALHEKAISDSPQ
jgi:hypothetical protein